MSEQRIGLYCFAEPTGRAALFFEATIRGWLAAVLDFPRLADREERNARSLLVGQDLRAEVCCIPSPDFAYHQLVSSAWVSSYAALEQVNERDITIMKVALKPMLAGEALALLNALFAQEGARAEVERSYAQFLLASGAGN